MRVQNNHELIEKADVDLTFSASCDDSLHIYPEYGVVRICECAVQVADGKPEIYLQLTTEGFAARFFGANLDQVSVRPMARCPAGRYIEIRMTGDWGPFKSERYVGIYAWPDDRSDDPDERVEVYVETVRLPGYDDVGF